MSLIILSMSNISNRKYNFTLAACLASFFGKNNYIIILFQSTRIKDRREIEQEEKKGGS
jgi:hypothetical protein